ncbi:hypothetical protein DL93DRAFT_1186738 [Clavulina sp. PMI_390]|nr:hypothetical protein DL93DRAFT_1186738 [Clavulina sp. PMI_390]
MTLPSLQRMTMSRFYGGHPPRIRIARASTSDKASSITKFSRGYAIRAMSSAITALHLQSSSASCEIVAEVLRLPLHLTTFEYRISSKVERPDPFNASELLPGLERHASSLRELTLVTERIEYYWDDDTPFIRSLSAFGALETLRVSLPIIFEGAEWFSMIDEPRDEDDEDDDPDDRGDLPAWRRPSRYPAWNCHQLLPPNLSSLELQVHPDAFLTFIKRSGLPQSLTVTRKHIPSLAKFSVIGASGYLEPLDHLLAQVPVLDPRMSVTFDVSRPFQIRD